MFTLTRKHGIGILLVLLMQMTWAQVVNAADYACAHLIVRDKLSFLLLEARVEIIGGDSSEPSAVPGELGDYLMCLPTGTYRVTITKDGYTPITQDLEIKQGTSTYELIMLPEPIPFSPGHIQFSDDGSTFGEEEANKQIYAYRVGGKDGPVSVDYQYTLSDGTVITGTLFWADQDAQPKPILIPVDDNMVSGTDSKFEITLFNAQGGAILEENTQHPVTIVDNDSPKPGMVQFVDGLIEVNLECQSTVLLQVERVRGTAGNLSVNYVVISPEKWIIATGIVTWPPGDSTPKEITIPAEQLPPEGGLLQVTLMDDNNVVLGDLQDAVVTTKHILIPPADCDCTNRVQFETATMPVKEDSGTVTFNVTLTRSGSSTCDVRSQVVVSLSDTVDVAGEITVAESDLGQTAEVIVFAGYRPSLDNPAEIFFMLDSEINILPWDEDVAKLVAYQPVPKLEKTLPVSLYQGHFVAPGHLNLFFGYRLIETGAVVYNAVPLEVDIRE